VTELPIIESGVSTKCPSSHKCGNEATEGHVCPYAAEINDDTETLCKCCDECVDECAWDI
jgi:hypothetical protein